MTHDGLIQTLLAAVRAQQFERTPDALLGGAPLRRFPSLDLALIAFARNAAPVFANVLFSHEHPRGIAAEIGADAGAVRNLRFEADRRDTSLVSDAWLPDADWSRMRFEPLWGGGAHRFVAPYPASLIKLMVAVGVARAADAGLCEWDDATTRACDAMLTVSSNDATTELIALLHRLHRLDDLHHAFASRGLHTLRLDGTREDGGWTNAAGAGVGRLQMTAWDTARLLWLLDADAPPAPWLARDAAPLVSDASRARLRRWLDEQALHEVLSSTALAGVPGWVPGLPAQQPARWIDAAGAVRTAGKSFPPDVRAASDAAALRFAHKTGTTQNYASDAGIVNGLAPARRHYIVALITSLGERHAPHPACATTWRVPALGRAIDEALAPWLEAS
jgi:beta-lactamase class A